MKNVYFGYGIVHRPEVGKSVMLRKVELLSCLMASDLTEKVVVTGPIEEIQQIGDNMSILWTEKDGYVVYWVQR